ncbi:TPA: DNA phosphorothioation system sulfurtransferase DndC [Pseudomonas aeruginosa]|nr:DNA phosphorothioation system sulfurtransferase DndC [Pseudomonas aeruginosa]MBU5718456.1 DNA phosphorothioation system sulfurtransferase DndC [Pseudomonas aeruginosa]MBU5784367.1 DNA phosphorothioation system sulfurtransferase DndC [Pseudomonas aeruginosa]OPE25165.1 sulfurtransferase [Pseudomonas aeruginosa]PBX95552.1 DNA phosphorothioation system sulfurtransferase DndC [Pseudomonas aeruginosa]
MKNTAENLVYVPLEQWWDSLLEEMADEYLDEAHNHPWIVGFSGGKDSTLVAHAAFEMLSRLRPSQRNREIHIVSNDTLVESPLVISHLDMVTEQIRLAGDSLALPIKVVRTYPEPDKTFWVLLIGKGYPSPNQTMRWCTDRLKIQPTSSYIKENVSRSGAAIVVLGVRKDESNTRKRSIEKRVLVRGSRLIAHEELPGAYIYRPIVDLVTDQVWEALATYTPPWGGTHRALIQLYRDAEGGECPVVLSKAEAPGCGTASSRFGCWTCTVIEKDKSLQGFVDSGKIQYSALIEFRDWLKEIRNDPARRQVTRRNGKVTFSNGKHVPGPFTINTRLEILERLLKLQEKFGDRLISESEIDEIKKIWSEDIASKMEIA